MSLYEIFSMSAALAKMEKKDKPRPPTPEEVNTAQELLWEATKNDKNVRVV